MSRSLSCRPISVCVLSVILLLLVSIFVESRLTRAVVVETKQMVVVLAVTEVNEDVVVQYLSWKMFGFGKNIFE